MAPSPLLLKLVEIYKGEKIRYPQLRAVTLAQWMLESTRATELLATQHYNFGGMKWRAEMAPYATKVLYKAHDGEDYYCKFSTVENFIAGYWGFINRWPYSGWEEHVSTAEEYIKFIGPIYEPKNPNYVSHILKLMPEAQGLLDNVKTESFASPAADEDLGTIVIDPGHGGDKEEPGSSSNNAISVSGVKEKKLTLDFCLILRDELLRQTKQAGQQINVVLTRTTDVNLSGPDRAGKAFAHKAKLFLCLHFNGSKDSKIKGCETFYRAPENDNLNLQDDIAFANAMNAAVFSAMQSLDAAAFNRGVKPDTLSGKKALGVLNDIHLGNDRTDKMCHAAYIELEYITNPGIDKLLVSGADAIANRTKIMAAVAKAIRKYMKDMN